MLINSTETCELHDGRQALTADVPAWSDILVEPLDVVDEPYVHCPLALKYFLSELQRFHHATLWHAFCSMKWRNETPDDGERRAIRMITQSRRAQPPAKATETFMQKTIEIHGQRVKLYSTDEGRIWSSNPQTIAYTEREQVWPGESKQELAPIDPIPMLWVSGRRKNRSRERKKELT